MGRSSPALAVRRALDEAAMKTKHHPIALNLPRIVALLIVYGRHVVKMMTDSKSTWFPAPTPDLATVTADIDALEAAQAVALTRTKGSAAVRDDKQKTVEDDLVGLKGYAYTVIAQHADKADIIAAAAGMSLKQFGKRSKDDLEAFDGEGLLEVVLRARAVPGGKRAAYEWQVSSDGGKSWTSLGVTTVADTVVPGLVPGTSYMFRYRTTQKRTTSDWSQTITFVKR